MMLTHKPRDSVLIKRGINFNRSQCCCIVWLKSSSTFCLFFNMAVPLRFSLVWDTKLVLSMKRLNPRNLIRQGALSTTSTSNYYYNANARCNPVFHSSSTARNVFLKPGRSMTFHSTGYKAILPPGPRKSYTDYRVFFNS